jgi:hypothetical protein
MKRLPPGLLLPAFLALAACETEVAAPTAEVADAQPAVLGDAIHASGSLTDAEILAAWAAVGAEIKDEKSSTTLTTHFAQASGSMKFVGTKAEMKTDERLYRNGVIQATPYDKRTYEASVARIALDAAVIMNGGKPWHPLGTSVDPIILDKPCGYRVTATSKHDASAFWKGQNVGSAHEESQANPKSLPDCPASDPSPGGSGSGGGSQTCYTVTTDHYYYYPDTGEVEYVGTDEYSYCVT